MKDWEAIWRDTWRALGLEPGPGWLPGLLARYAEPQRRYHTLQHLAECFASFDTLCEDAARPGEVRLAIWFHDAVYDVRGSDNEERSAGLARVCLREAGAAQTLIERVDALIMATRRHEAVEGDADCAILLDADLAILGAAAGRFDEYEAQVRAEYAHVPEDAWRAGRAKVLRRFLARSRLYATERFYEACEAQARANLARSLASLMLSPPAPRSSPHSPDPSPGSHPRTP